MTNNPWHSRYENPPQRELLKPEEPKAEQPVSTDSGRLALYIKSTPKDRQEPMIPQTRNGMNSFECVSALQKCIRRNMEAEAVHFALEMATSSKGFCTRILNRLVVIAQEDIGLADVPTVTYVLETVAAARQIYSKDKTNRTNVSITNAVMALCRANKGRSGNWLSAISVDAVERGITPVVEDWMLDQHTQKGKKMGRGFEHFLAEGLKLVPDPEHPELYETQGIEVRRRQAEEQQANRG